MQGKTENIRHCFNMNKKIFPPFITENIFVFVFCILFLLHPIDNTLVVQYQ